VKLNHSTRVFADRRSSSADAQVKKSGAGKGRRQKEKGRSFLSFASLDEYPSQLDPGKKVFLAHQPNFFILPFAF
jgi:hypothetical protein